MRRRRLQQIFYISPYKRLLVGLGITAVSQVEQWNCTEDVNNIRVFLRITDRRLGKLCKFNSSGGTLLAHNVQFYCFPCLLLEVLLLLLLLSFTESVIKFFIIMSHYPNGSHFHPPSPPPYSHNKHIPIIFSRRPDDYE